MWLDIFQSHAQRMLLWTNTSILLLICGFLMQLIGNTSCYWDRCIDHLIASIYFDNFFVGMPFSKPLYTLSYMFLTAGVSGFLFILIYFIVSSLCILIYLYSICKTMCILSVSVYFVSCSMYILSAISVDATSTLLSIKYAM